MSTSSFFFILQKLFLFSWLLQPSPSRGNLKRRTEQIAITNRLFNFFDLSQKSCTSFDRETPCFVFYKSRWPLLLVGESHSSNSTVSKSIFYHPFRRAFLGHGKSRQVYSQLRLPPRSKPSLITLSLAKVHFQLPVSCPPTCLPVSLTRCAKSVSQCSSAKNVVYLAWIAPRPSSRPCVEHWY